MTVLSGLNRGARWVIGTSTHACWLGSYESEKQAVLRRLLRPGQVVFDIGANAGFYTLACARAVGPTGHVWAFEPLAENAANLLRHMALNGIANVTLIQAAVSGEAGISGFARASHNAMGHISSASDYLVPTVAIDQLRRESVLPEPSVMKIDVEGAEALVLEGARETLAIGRTTVLLALHGAEQERACLRILEELEFTLEYLDGTIATGRPLVSDEIVAVPSAFRSPGAVRRIREACSCAEW